jgi:hypothetical protein
VLPLAVAIAIFPVPVIACVLLVGGENGLVKAGSYVAAWFLGLVAIGAVVLIVADAADGSDDGKPATWVSVLLLALGVLCLAASARGWRGRPRNGEEAPAPSWMRSIDRFTVFKSAGAGLAFSAFNPKNILLAAAAAVEIAEFGLGRGSEFAALLVLAVLAYGAQDAPSASARAPLWTKRPVRVQQCMWGSRLSIGVARARALHERAWAPAQDYSRADTATAGVPTPSRRAKRRRVTWPLAFQGTQSATSTA